jgi:hypothetical protein
MALPFVVTVAVLPLASAAPHHCLHKLALLTMRMKKDGVFGIITIFYFSSENKTLDAELTPLFSDTAEIAFNHTLFCCTLS